MIAWMHEARVRAYQAAFHHAMEFWAREEPVPDECKRLSKWMKRRHPEAVAEGGRRIAAEAAGPEPKT